MFKIRRGVFETNSSSVHALNVYKKKKTDIPRKDIPKEVDITLSDYGFGWESDTHNDFNSRLAYICLVTLQDVPDIKKMNAMYNKIKALLKAVGVKKISIDRIHKGQNVWDEGYVDHGDMAVDFVERLLDKPELFYGWLFDGRSCIDTGNDNDHTEPPRDIHADFAYIKTN